MTNISYEQLTAVLGDEAVERVLLLAAEAEHIGLRFALVGGVVRDVLLGMPTTDYDFLVDGGPLGLGAAAELAAAVKDRYDGVVKSHTAFGTATWTPPAAFTDGDPLAPDHYDFASAREELYERLGALPVPAPTTLEDDLRRRDFTVNAMALILAPQAEFGAVVDPHDGQRDLDAGILRVMHRDSFSDDPTRIYRGARLAARLGFTFDKVAEQIMLRGLRAVDNVSGERLRTELRLLLLESSSADALAMLDEYGALEAIHPALCCTPTLDDDLLAIHDDPPADLETAAWCAWLCRLDPADIRSIAVRLAFSASLASAVNCAALLVADPGGLLDDRPSVVARRLHGLPEPSIVAAGRVLGGRAAENAARYLDSWRYYRTGTTGETLKQLGVPPGPRYKLILQQLLDARLDGLIRDDRDEAAALRDLLDSLPADDPT